MTRTTRSIVPWFVLFMVLAFATASAEAGRRGKPLPMKELLSLATQSISELDDPHPELTPEIVVGFVLKESGGNPKARGDGGLAWGLGQFWLARWLECGGTREEYRRAGARRQMEVLAEALNSYFWDADDHDMKDKVRWAGNWHNAGHGRNVETKYVRDVRKFIRLAHRN